MEGTTMREVQQRAILEAVKSNADILALCRQMAQEAEFRTLLDRTSVGLFPRTKVPKSETKVVSRENRGGRRLTVSKEIYIEIIRIANTPDGLPDRDRLTPWLQEKFPQASESNLRSILADVYSSLNI
jgi:hypothetical protein